MLSVLYMLFDWNGSQTFWNIKSIRGSYLYSWIFLKNYVLLYHYER